MVNSKEKKFFAGKPASCNAGLKLCPRSESPTHEFRMKILEETKDAPWQNQETVRQLQRSLVVQLLSPLSPHLRRR